MKSNLTAHVHYLHVKGAYWESQPNSIQNFYTWCLKLFELVHMDLAGPMHTQSIQGNCYYYILVYNHMQYKCVFFIQQKNDTFNCFKQFNALISTQFSVTIRATHSDRRGEFLSTEFTKYMESKGIIHQLTAPHTPQQNSIAKHVNHTVAEAAQAMLQSMGLCCLNHHPCMQ